MDHSWVSVPGTPSESRERRETAYVPTRDGRPVHRRSPGVTVVTDGADRAAVPAPSYPDPG
ncbi:hypothetical protein CUT44_27395 [Streptomyces carminius]|uniref:Uncharacterized protein n=1 Tax=Streptomyces carminius TaxID=2665496 RepID=A0A2M8LQ06_9ACTN|nr:hypothetical protein CUT44_27395 [Streptomyces carminius]